MILKQKLVLLLSDPDISDSEFKSVKSWLERGGIEKILGDAESFRSALRFYQTPTTRQGQRSSVARDDSFVSQINDLLRVEAGMTARVALSVLAERVGEENLPERISFADGVTRLGKLAGNSRVLTVAYQIRNDMVHTPTERAWPLNRG